MFPKLTEQQLKDWCSQIDDEYYEAYMEACKEMDYNPYLVIMFVSALSMTLGNFMQLATFLTLSPLQQQLYENVHNVLTNLMNLYGKV